MARRRCAARCVGLRSHQLADNAFASQLAVRWPGGVDTRLRFHRCQLACHDTTPSTNARPATTATSVTNTAPIVDASAGGSVRVDCVQPATSRWPSPICYLQEPSCLTPTGKGAKPLSPDPYPRCLRHPEISKKEVNTGQEHEIFGQLCWPPLGRSHDRQRAPFEAATGQVAMAVDTNLNGVQKGVVGWFCSTPDC